MLTEKKKTIIRPVSVASKMDIHTECDNRGNLLILNDEELKAYVKMAMAHSDSYYVTTANTHQGELNIIDGYINFYPAIIMDHEIIEFDATVQNMEEVVQTVNNAALFKNAFVTRNAMVQGKEIEDWEPISDSIYETPEIRKFMLDILDYAGYTIDLANEKLLLHSFINSCPNHISNEEWTKSYQKRR